MGDLIQLRPRPKTSMLREIRAEPLWTRCARSDEAGPIDDPALRQRGTCPVCDFAIWGAPEFAVTCRHCRCEVHSECYWGRTVPLSEWIEFQRLTRDTPLEDLKGPGVLCSACRTAGPREGSEWRTGG